MAFTRDQAYASLASVKPAWVFLESYRNRRLPENLHIYFGPPEEFFIGPDTQERYTRNHLVPILDDGNFGLVVFLDPSTRELVQLDIESPDESRVLFQSWQQYLADLMIRVGESIEDDERIRRISDLIGFAHTDELFEFYALTQGVTGHEWWEARRRFLLSISVEPISRPPPNLNNNENPKKD